MPSVILRPAARVARGQVARPLVSVGGAVLALALPLIFLHVDYQPGFTIHVGGTSVGVYLSDLAVLAVAVAAALTGFRWGFRPLQAASSIWVVALFLLVLVFAATLYPLTSSRSYAWHTHLVTAAKFAEYAVLAPALPLLVRRVRELWLLLGALVAWSVVATVVGIAQFFGWSVAEAWAPGRRQPSFLGHHDFAALSCSALAVGIVALVLPGWRVNRALAAVGSVSGLLGLVVSGSSAAAIGIGAAAIALLAAGWRRRTLTAPRVAALAAAAAVAAGGVLALRGGDFDQFVHFLGIGKPQPTASQHVQTYVQHTLLAYIGLEIFLAHPILGVGWEGSSEASAYGPHLAEAHRRFPHAAQLSFPSPLHPWGVQNGYVQALADLGVVGFLLFVGLFASGLVVAARRALRAAAEEAGPALVAGVWLLAAMGIWGALGLIAGIPLDALTWLGLGLAAAAAAGTARAAV